MRHDDEHDEDATGWDLPGQLGDDDPTQETEVECPYCGEVVPLTLDSSGGATQDYVEDCQVCCRPWKVHVSYDVGGAVEVKVEPSS